MRLIDLSLPVKPHFRWPTEVYQIEADFKAKVESKFNKMIESVTVQPVNEEK